MGLVLLHPGSDLVPPRGQVVSDCGPYPPPPGRGGPDLPKKSMKQPLAPHLGAFWRRVGLGRVSSRASDSVKPLVREVSGER